MIHIRCPKCNTQVLVYAGLENADYICNNNHKFKLAKPDKYEVKR